MRVISGTARGLKLTSLSGDATRPTLDNVKEAVFSMLFDRVVDAKVLDLFAGSGQMALEAVSRGAAEAVLIPFNSFASETGSKEAIQVSIEVSPSDEVALYFPDTLKTVSEQVMADRHVIPHASVAMSVCSLVF